MVQKVRELVSDPKVINLIPNPSTQERGVQVLSTGKDLDDPQFGEVSFTIDSKLPIFDMEVVNQLREMVGDETMISVFEDFEREAEEQIQNAKKAYPDDVKTIQRELHTLKGNSGTIGLARIHEITEIIEVPSKTGDLTHFLEGMAVLEKEFANFKEIYRTVI